MSRWDIYLDRIDEKVSKKEITEALKNDNILVGCEFEFKVDESLVTNGGSEISELYSSAYDEVQSYNTDVDTYDSEIDEYESDTAELAREIERKQDRIDELEAAIEDQNDHNDELDDQISTADSDKDGAESDLSDHMAEDIEDWDEAEWEKTKSDLETIISNAKVDIYRHKRSRESNDGQETTWQDELDGLERDKRSDEDDLKYREDEGRFEQVETPYASEQTMSSYFEYMTNWMGYSNQDLYIEPGERMDDPPEWDNEGYDDFEEAINNSGILTNAPFTDYNIGEYGNYSPKPGSKTWAVENDSSLGESGVEVKNPPMEINKFIPKVLNEMFDWIDEVGSTDSDCGFHCHMSLKKSGILNEIDFLKLVLFTDEEWIYSAFEDRAHTTYATSVKDKIKSQTSFTRKDINDLFSRKKLIMKLQMQHQHFDAINLIDAKTGHVEFRYLGGTDYHKQGKEVTAMIGMFAHNLSLAMDPEFKRKEYHHKLERIFNKMEMYYVEVVSELIDHLIADGDKQALPDDKKKLFLLRKKQGARYKMLASIYKLDKKTRGLLNRNTAFRKGVVADARRFVSRDLSASLKSKIQNW